MDSLQRLYLDEAGILARGVSWDGSTYRVGKPSLLDTANVLLALYALRTCGIEGPLDADRLLERCVSDHLEASDYPEIAILLWADSLGGQAHTARLFEALQQRLPRKVSNTMQLSWVLSAVCALFEVGLEQDAAKRLAKRLYDRITRNQFSPTGLFHSSGQREGLLRRRPAIAHLPSQVFAIQALAQYSESFDERQAIERAVGCADRLCALQGPEGQWWCVYDVREGTVVQQYPVYSVHQDGAMPAALSLVTRVVHDRRFDEAADRGLTWVFGNNELTTSLVDDQQALILRGIRQEGDGLGIIREMRTYHPGRCLYALAVAESTRNRSSH